MELTKTQFGQYRVEEEVGRGQATIVYRAVDTVEQREVALKTITSYYSHYPAVVNHIVDGARDAMSLRHTHIASTYDVGQVDGIHYVAQQFVSGPTLENYLDFRQLPMSLKEVQPIITQIATALDHASEQGIAHANLKPSNVFLAGDGRVIVSDFAQRSVPADLLLGTSAYIAPEQARGEVHLTNQTDVYSLGVIAYQLLSGTLPFRGENVVVLMQRIVEDNLPPLRPLNPELSSDVAWVVEQALAKSPEDRFASATEFARTVANPPTRSSYNIVPTSRPKQGSARGVNGSGRRRRAESAFMVPSTRATTALSTPRYRPPAQRRNRSSLDESSTRVGTGLQPLKILLGLLATALLALFGIALYSYLNGGLPTPPIVVEEPAVTVSEPEAISVRPADNGVESDSESAPQIVTVPVTEYRDPTGTYQIQVPVSWTRRVIDNVTIFAATDSAARIFVYPLAEVNPADDPRTMVAGFLNDTTMIERVELEVGESQRVGRIQAFDQSFQGQAEGAEVAGRLVGINANGKGVVLGAMADVESARSFGPIFNAVIDSFVFTADTE